VQTQSITTDAVRIRWAIRSDIDAILRIDGQTSRPWLCAEYTRSRRENIQCVAETQEQVVGFVAYSLFRRKYRIDRLAVDAGHRRTGVASRLISHMKEKLSPATRNRLVFDVADDLLEMHLFLKSQGFLASPRGEVIRFEFFV